MRRVPRISVQCPMCPVVFEVRQARLDSGQGKYCSVPCQVLSQQVSPEQRHATKLRASRRTHTRHKAKENAYSRAYVAARREAMAAASRAYYAAHPEERAAYGRAYARLHPEIFQISAANRRAQKRAAVGALSAEQWQEILAAYGYRCAYCRAKPRRLTIDHITPLSKGGSHTASNVVPACRSCNAHKFTGPPPVPVQPLLLTLAAPSL